MRAPKEAVAFRRRCDHPTAPSPRRHRLTDAAPRPARADREDFEPMPRGGLPEGLLSQRRSGNTTPGRQGASARRASARGFIGSETIGCRSSRESIDDQGDRHRGQALACVRIAEAVLDRLEARYGGDLVIVHGDCRTGVDAAFDDVATRRRLTIERHPADWSRGRRAGPERNRAMVLPAPNFASPCIAHSAARGARGGPLSWPWRTPSPVTGSRQTTAGPRGCWGSAGSRCWWLKKQGSN